MSIIRLQEMTPQIYTEESRDFQLLTRLYDSVFNGMKFDTDSITSLINTKECRTNILQLLQTKLGFFTERKLDDEKLRSILECFPILVRNKGSLKAIKEALYLFLRMYSVSSDMEIYYLKTPFSEPFSEEEPCVLANGKYPENNSLIIRIHSFQTKPDISVLEELFRYILPAGINYYIEFDKKGKLSDIVLSSEDSAELLFVSDNINSEIRNSGQIFTTDDTDSETSKIAYKLGAVNTISLISTDSYVSNRFIGYYTSEEDANDYLETLTDKLYSTAIINYDPVETKTGSIVSFLPDPSVTKLDDLTVNIEPVQDLHGYDSPWPGGGGKNLWKFFGNGFVAADGTIGSASNNARSDYFEITPNTTYTFGTANASSLANAAFMFYDENKTAILPRHQTTTASVTATAPANAKYAMASVAQSSGLITEQNCIAYQIQFEARDALSSYVPYSNICPITGWTSVDVWRAGVNVWDEEWELGTINANTGANATDNSVIRTKNYIPILPNTRYFGCVVDASSGYNFRSRFYDADKNYIGTGGSGLWNYNRSYITPQSAYYLRFAMQADYGTTYNNDISINYPATDTDYHAYSGNQYTIQLGETVYGGTLDVVNGKMTVDRAIVDMGTLTFGLSSEALFNTNSLVGSIKPANWTSEITKSLCSEYAANTGAAVYQKRADCSFGIDGNGRMYIYDSTKSTMTAAEFKTAMSGVQLCYELATPFEIPLTPVQIATLQGTNDVWSDAGDVTITYRRDFTCVPMICTSYTNNTPTWRRINFLGNLTLEDVSTEGGIVAALEARGITVNDGDLILYNNIYLLRVNGSWQECNYARYIMNTYNITE